MVTVTEDEAKSDRSRRGEAVDPTRAITLEPRKAAYGRKTMDESKKANVAAIMRSTDLVRVMPVTGHSLRGLDSTYSRNGESWVGVCTGKKTTANRLSGRLAGVDTSRVIIEFYDSRGSKIASM